MEEKKQKSINEILPVELIQRILLRIPVKHLGRLKCVSKLWYSLISDPDFAESHLHLSLAPTHACLKYSTEAYVVHLEEVFNGDNYQVKEVSFPFKKKPPPGFGVVGSCRGFVLFCRRPHLFVIWNPLTGFSKRISCPCIVHRSKRRCVKFPGDSNLYGFGHDASRDDYLVVVGWSDGCGNCQHLDCLSLTTNSWINLDVALLKPLGSIWCRPPGLFLNGSIHWLFSSLEGEGLLIFDLKERSFSKISLPEQLITGRNHRFVILGGCLAFYSHGYFEHKTDIWVMKEYKVQSSWTLYAIPGLKFDPLCLSNGSDIIGVDPFPASIPVGSLKLVKYNIREELLQHFTCLPRLRHHAYYYGSCTYTESLLVLPSDSKHKDKKKNVI